MKKTDRRNTIEEEKKYSCKTNMAKKRTEERIIYNYQRRITKRQTKEIATKDAKFLLVIYILSQTLLLLGKKTKQIFVG
jgi:hypothetical protein